MEKAQADIEKPGMGFRRKGKQLGDLCGRLHGCAKRSVDGTTGGKG